jgi:hypothetical protein
VNAVAAIERTLCPTQSNAGRCCFVVDRESAGDDEAVNEVVEVIRE